MRRNPERLPIELIELLAPFFSDLDLSGIRIFEGLPWYVRGRPQGYAERYCIYLKPGCFSIDTIEGISLIAHEIAHCRQYAKYGAWRFRALYLSSYFKNRSRGMDRKQAYLNIPFEIEAREVEENVSKFLLGLREEAVV